jgi:signal transduction histidine kinase
VEPAIASDRSRRTNADPPPSLPRESLSVNAWPHRILTSGHEAPLVWSIVVNVLCGLVAIDAAVALAGWVLSNPTLTNPIHGLGPMRWTTALAFLMVSIAIVLRHIRSPARVLVSVGDILSLAPLGIALFSLFTNLFQSTPGIPHLVYLRSSDFAASHLFPESFRQLPWRMSFGAGLGVATLSLALLLLDRLRRISTTLLSVGIMLSLAAICGFLFRARHLFGPGLIDAMSVQTALSLLALFAAAFAARPMREPMRSLFAPELGIEARMELLVGTWALPLLIGLAVQDGFRRGWYEPSLALALFAVAVIGLQTLLIWRSDLALTQLIKNKQRMEEVLRKNEKLAVAGRLAASISHEINNPLESISNLLYLIRTSDSSAEQHTYADMAIEELRRVTQITTQTLSFYRENTAPILSDVNPILESSVQLLRGKISSMGIDVVEEYYPPLPAIICSAGELRQVLVNLISNALDATPRGGRIVVRAALSKAWTRAGKSVLRIAVADSGSGMPPRVLARVFEPFYTTKEKTGNGLGLWVAADLIEKHGGWMKVRSSTVGGHQGTTFQLVLPIGSAE